MFVNVIILHSSDKDSWIRTGTMAKRKRSEHYVNNKEFLAALIYIGKMLTGQRLQ